VRLAASLATLATVFKLHALPRTLSAAERDVQSREAKVRLSALADLGRFTEEPARSSAVALVRQSLRDADLEVRARALLVLADLRAEECTDELLRLLGDAQPRVRQMTLVALGELARPGDAVVLGRVGAFLTVAEPALRYQALAAWARLQPEPPVEVLVERSTDADAEVRALALRLAQERWLDVGRALPPQILHAASARLADDSPHVRLLAAILLGRAARWAERTPAEREAAERILLEAVDRRRGISEPIDEQEAIELCGALPIEAARRALRRRAFGLWGTSRDPFALQAKVALALLGDERARDSILAGLSARSWHVRSASAEAAARARLVEALPRIAALKGDPEMDAELLDQAIARLEGNLAGPTSPAPST
jgi:HEAT repeat protein